MYNANKPNPSDLPSAGQLVKSTAIALGLAAGLLVTVVLPAEYGVDPTGVGSLLGLTEMGRIKVALAAEAAAEADTPSSSVGTTPVAARPTAPAATVVPRADTTVITLAPNQAAEIKLVMSKAAKARFSWVSSGGKVNFDTHADAPGIKYHAYDKGSEVRVEGELVAAFDGSHGWFWRNRSGAPVTITLKTEGAYSALKRVV